LNTAGMGHARPSLWRSAAQGAAGPRGRPRFLGTASLADPRAAGGRQSAHVISPRPTTGRWCHSKQTTAAAPKCGSPMAFSASASAYACTLVGHAVWLLVARRQAARSASSDGSARRAYL